jgi:hypothetical protein
MNMKKLKLAFLPVFLFTILFTSCIDIIENMVVNKDGTGSYSVTMDMGKLMHDPFLKGMMEQSEGNNMEDKDSTFFMSELPDSLIGDNREFWSRVSMRVVTHEKEEEFYIKINLDYKDVSEISYLAKNLDKVMSSTNSNPLGSGEKGSGPTPGFLSESIKFAFSGKELVRTSDDTNVFKDEPGEDLEMIKSFLSGAEYKINYQLPKKVRKVNMDNAKVNGKNVSVSVPLTDIMENKVSLNGSIRF